MITQRAESVLPIKILLCLLAIVFIAYLPATSFFYYIKNDAFTGYFPPKFFMSESLHAGYLPLWNPYINYGIPQYGDMSSAFWNPITWLIASTVGYNAYSFTLEIFCYIFTGGVGMFYLCKQYGCRNAIALSAAAAYICSGYNVGNLQHFNWVSGAAFLPVCLYSYNALLKNQTAKNYVRAGVVFYLFISAAHPGIVIASVYFFLAYSIFKFFQQKDSNTILPDNLSPASSKLFKPSLFRHFKTNVLLLIFILLLCAGMIAGYADALPQLTRGSKISLSSSLQNPTGFTAWLSLIYPFATVKNNAFFATDISMRNCYIGIAGIILLLSALWYKKSKLQVFMLASGGFFALLSSGGLVKTAAYYIMPFIGYVRLNGEFRIFTLLCLIIVAALHWEKIVRQQTEKKLTSFFLAFLCIVFTALIGSVIYALYSGDSLLINIIRGQYSLTAGLKGIIDNLSWADTFIIQSLIHFPIILGLWYFAKHKKINYAVAFIALDLIAATLLNMPFTGVGNNSVKEIQAVINTSPAGIPVPANKAVVSIKAEDEKSKLVGDWSMYSKQPGTLHEVLYPIVLQNSKDYLDTILSSGNEYRTKPLAYTTSEGAILRIRKFTASKYIIQYEVSENTNLVIQQNWYPHWYYDNDKLVEKIENNNFISLPLSSTEKTVKIEFRPLLVILSMFFSACLFLLSFIFLLVKKD